MISANRTDLDQLAQVVQVFPQKDRRLLQRALVTTNGDVISAIEVLLTSEEFADEASALTDEIVSRKGSRIFDAATRSAPAVEVTDAAEACIHDRDLARSVSRGSTLGLSTGFRRSMSDLMISGSAHSPGADGANERRVRSYRPARELDIENGFVTVALSSASAASIAVRPHEEGTGDMGGDGDGEGKEAVRRGASSVALREPVGDGDEVSDLEQGGRPAGVLAGEVGAAAGAAAAARAAAVVAVTNEERKRRRRTMFHSAARVGSWRQSRDGIESSQAALSSIPSTPQGRIEEMNREPGISPEPYSGIGRVVVGVGGGFSVGAAESSLEEAKWSGSEISRRSRGSYYLSRSPRGTPSRLGEQLDVGRVQGVAFSAPLSTSSSAVVNVTSEADRLGDDAPVSPETPVIMVDDDAVTPRTERIDGVDPAMGSNRATVEEV